MSLDIELFSRELERVRLRAMMAIERIATRPDEVVFDRIGTELARLEEELAAQRAGGRAQWLGARLGLVDDDLDLLWTCVACAADPRVLPHAQVLGGTEARRGLSIGTYALIADLDGPRAHTLMRRLSGPHPLLRDHILTWAGEGHAAAARPLVAPSRIITWLAGDDDLDAAMLGAGRISAPVKDLRLDARQEEALARLPDALGAVPAPLVVVDGVLGSGRRTAVATVAGMVSVEVVELNLRYLPPGITALEGALIGLHRECRLRDAIPLIADIDEIGGSGAEGAANAFRVLARVLDHMPGPVAVTTERAGVEIPVARPIVRIGWPTPETAVRRALWQDALGHDAAELDPVLDGIALRYRLGAGGIHRAAESARLIARNEAVSAQHVIEGIRSTIAERLGELATRQEIRQSWDELVLAPDIADQVSMLVARVRHSHRVLEEWGFASKLPKGIGVAALFSGPPGTGKTMVAGLIAQALELELYQVDLSKVVSKWVGETEKQLARIFDAAEAGHALLLFDEADALFAKRTEVKSAVDRYANLEVNYLLQRIESFGGVSILTTNLDTSIDPALRRRLASHIMFAAPELDERERLWRAMLTSRAPIVSSVDHRALADEFDEMTGANIRNAALSAAFLAAAENAPITQATLNRAARVEYLAMGRVLGKGGQR